VFAYATQKLMITSPFHQVHEAETNVNCFVP